MAAFNERDHRLSLRLAVLTLAAAVLSAGARADGDDGMQRCVVAVGDVDKDGRGDLLVATRDRVLPEIVWLMSGATGQALHEFRGVTPGDGFGCAMAAAGDVDHDGVPDVLIAARGGTWRDSRDDKDGYKFHPAGRVYIQVRSGKDGSLIRQIEPAALTYCNQVSIDAGDLDGDGVPDVLIGLMDGPIGFPDRHAPVVAAYSGADGKQLFELSNVDRFASRSFGCAVAVIGDIDGDGLAEFAIGDPSAKLDLEVKPPPRDLRGTGRVILFSGRTHLPLATAWGDHPTDEFGTNLVRIADCDGDGRPDLVAAAESKYVHILSTKDMHSIVSSKTRRPADIDSFGSSLDACDALRRDGHPCFLVGADETLPGFFDLGYVQLVSSDPRHEPELLIETFSCGIDVACAGLIDGDDIPDFAFVLHAREPASASPGGVLRLISGKDCRLLREVALVQLRERSTRAPSASPR